ncbi:MAG: UDP-N-acetylmuramoyl-L-alanyl-D-glutamate--2,6-diaminopimelate ligase, partial [Actinobacteria bacterium]|nr:UDP-N-acetylmuramoyl-L-alanyl-D-glutamate--2,6-diaminopimelate ligase [Actinomycetota bacterium]
MSAKAVRQLDDLLASTTEVKVSQIIGDSKVKVSDITHDSSKVSLGAIFCCVVGENADGHNFANVAVANGAVALLVERRVEVDVTQVVVSDVRSAMGYIAAELFNRPSRKMSVIGVTGTNGKTTTAHLLAAILQQHGWSTSIIGTLTGSRTTPESTDLQRHLANEHDRGCKAVVMEVSSHALTLRRVEGTSFKIAVFTNLGQDHLDFHKSHIWQGQKIEVGMGGHFNVMNALAAATAAAKLGVTAGDIAKGLAAASAVPGRFESVSVGQKFSVVVDYAHTPEALQNVLLATRQLITKTARIILVFGCGGGRDQSKRPMMGDIATKFADVVLITSDNPRHEDAQTIADEIL